MATVVNRAKDKIMAVNVKHYFESGKADEIPTLEAGDMVLVTQLFGNKFRNAIGINSLFGVLAAVATVALIVDRLSQETQDLTSRGQNRFRF